MTILNVQFTDDTQTVINGYFNCAQDPSVYKNMGEVDANDARYKTYYEALSGDSQLGLPQPE